MSPLLSLSLSLSLSHTHTHTHTNTRTNTLMQTFKHTHMRCLISKMSNTNATKSQPNAFKTRNCQGELLAQLEKVREVHPLSISTLSILTRKMTLALNRTNLVFLFYPLQKHTREIKIVCKFRCWT